MIRTRFAPSPTGPLHLGHAYSAILAHDFARAHGGEFLLRIEDIDQSRSRAEWEKQIYVDLRWLGLDWDEAPIRQSDRLANYGQALDHLWHSDKIYPCTCSRKDIRAAASAPQEGADPLVGPDGIIYPGTCRTVSIQCKKPRPLDQALRLNLDAVFATLGERQDGTRFFTYQEIGPAGQRPNHFEYFTTEDAVSKIGDVVVARRDMMAAYHLAVVLDDADQGITHVIRGADLEEATKIHVILQHCLKLPTPVYYHHKLIRDEAGKRLAKRDDAKSISKFRAEGASPDDIRRMVGL